MIVGVVGSRKFTNYVFMRRVLDSYPKGIDMIVSGGAKGADELAYKYAIEKGITFVCYPPKPEDGYPRMFFRRNIRIVNHAEEIIAFPTKESRGTWHTCKKGKELGKNVWIAENGEIRVYD